MSLAEENQFLMNWETQVADQRIHGTTKQQVEKLFLQAERRALMPPPAERFPFFHEARRAVHQDGHLEVDKAYYSAPPEYVGHRLWVRWDARLVRVFNDRWEQVAVHAKAEPGRFRTAAEHIPKEKVSAVERGTDALLRQVAATSAAHKFVIFTVCFLFVLPQRHLTTVYLDIPCFGRPSEPRFCLSHRQNSPSSIDR